MPGFANSWQAKPQTLVPKPLGGAVIIHPKNPLPPLPGGRNSASQGVLLLFQLS